MMRNKKAWLRILEAFIAIILITGVLIVLYSGTIERPEKGEEIYKLQETILDEVASDIELREAVLNNTTQILLDFISEKVPIGFEFAIKICDVDNICELEKYVENKDIYSSERIISSTLHIYSPKKLKIFMWRK